MNSASTTSAAVPARDARPAAGSTSPRRGTSVAASVSTKASPQARDATTSQVIGNAPRSRRSGRRSSVATGATRPSSVTVRNAPNRPRVLTGFMPAIAFIEIRRRRGRRLTDTGGPAQETVVEILGRHPSSFSAALAAVPVPVV